MSRRYFEEELRYLHEAGKEFAAAHPEQARYLNIDSVNDRDPFVERLFEGFAFLTGRIRDQLDNEMVEYTEGLFGLLWPQVVRPMPAAAIVEFTPRPGLLQQTARIEAGTSVDSGPVGDEDTVCRFTTSQAVRLQPIKLLDMQLESSTGAGGSRMDLRFGPVGGGINFSNLELSPLSLFLHADQPLASAMHLFFTRRVERVVLWTGPARENAVQSVELGGQEAVRPGGFAPEESLLPGSEHSFTGYRLMHEYLNFRAKFNFVDLHGMDRVNLAAAGGEFHIEIHFDQPYPEDKRFTVDNLRLHCSPMVNLFRVDTDPLRVDHQAAEYRVVPNAYQPRSMEVYSVEQMTGVENTTGLRRDYLPFCGIKHASGQTGRYFTTSTRPNAMGQSETYIAIGGTDLEGRELLPETLSMSAMCTNGNLPRERLSEGSITRPGPDFANLATLKNLTRPTLRLEPPGRRQPELFWRLLSHLSFNYTSAATRENLVGQLQLYDWTEGEANRRRIAAVHKVTWEHREQVYRGTIVRGAEVVVEIIEDHFADEGDVCLFGHVMSEFFRLYATINSFVHLTIVTIPSGRIYAWHPEKGTKSPI